MKAEHNELTPRQWNVLRRIKPFLEVPFHYELHVEDKDIRKAKEEIIEGVRVIKGTIRGEAGIEDDFSDTSKVTIGFGGIAITLQKKHLEEMIRRYRHNAKLRRKLQ